MAKRLTEEMVIARTKISDLSKIKRLNCWGSELVDLSLLKRMPCVEVLSFSVNKINSLEDFQYCKRLEELYIRQNDIRDLNQVIYLKDLPNLKNLWLGENPCASVDGYRLAVIRALPQLQKLDNVAVTPEEVKEAARRGVYLTHPDDHADSEEEEFTQAQRCRGYVCPRDYSPPMTPVMQESENEIEDVDEYYSRENVRSEDPPPPYSTVEEVPVQRSQEVTRRVQSPVQTYSTWRRNSNERETTSPQQQYHDRSPPSTNANEEHVCAPPENFREIRLVTSHSTNNIKEYTNGERYQQSSNVTWDRFENSDGINSQRRDRPTCSASIRPPFNRRPVTRNSNILSAVLCLVKELDYPSLEVVEMAVRCRMDELDE